MRLACVGFMVVLMMSLAGIAGAINGAPAQLRNANGLETIVPADAQLMRLTAGCLFTEGPVWLESEKALLFSDIMMDRVRRWTAEDGTKVWREPSHITNGLTLDLEGRVIACEHQSRRVTRTEKDGSITVLASTYAGKRLNSPNDVIVQSDGTIWFTDPQYGIKPEEMEQQGNYVFRLDPGAKEPVPVARDFIRPNGLCFSPDEKRLYVADSSDLTHVRVFTVTPEHTLTDGRVFAHITPGIPDGMRVDTNGNLYVTAGDGIQIFRPDGTPIGTILVPEPPANCTFGGPERRTLYITARTTIYAITLLSQGAK